MSNFSNDQMTGLELFGFSNIVQVGEEDSLWRLQLVRGEVGLEATLHRRDYLDTELEVV